VITPGWEEEEEEEAAEFWGEGRALKGLKRLRREGSVLCSLMTI